MKKKWPILLAVLLTLAACSSDKDKDKDAEGEKIKKEAEAKAAVAPKKALPICPQVAIVRELDDIHDYGAEKPATSQLVSEARMESVEGSCAYEDTGVSVDFDVNFTAARGPRMGGDHASFPFFIAVTNPAEEVMTKEPMTVEFRFSDDKEKNLSDKTEHLHVFLPLSKVDREKGPDHQVLIGFQLTQEQLDAVRAKSKLPD